MSDGGASSRPSLGRAFASLRGFARDPATEPERCALCGAVVPAEHKHLLERENRALRCSCAACALLFEGRGDDARFAVVRPRAEPLPDVRITDAGWTALAIPVGLALIAWSSRDRAPIALYPGAAGMAEARVDAGAWRDLVERNPALGTLLPDIDALMVHRDRSGATECFAVSLDHGYRLAGLVRSRWRGLSGGDAVREAIDGFVGAMRAGSVGA